MKDGEIEEKYIKWLREKFQEQDKALKHLGTLVGSLIFSVTALNLMLESNYDINADNYRSIVADITSLIKEVTAIAKDLPLDIEITTQTSKVDEFDKDKRKELIMEQAQKRVGAMKALMEFSEIPILDPNEAMKKYGGLG